MMTSLQGSLLKYRLWFEKGFNRDLQVSVDDQTSHSTRLNPEPVSLHPEITIIATPGGWPQQSRYGRTMYSIQ